MAGAKVNFEINIIGDKAKVAINKINESVKNLGSNISKLSFEEFTSKIAKLNLFAEGIERMNGALQGAIAPGVSLNAELMQLSAITGESGKGLREIEGYARELAKEFGIDAAGGVRSFSLLLSQLSPELAKEPKLLKEMGRNVAILSKQMGGDMAAAAELLTTAMNQYGVNTDDAEGATAQMSRMMNVMAAAAREGSAEMPQIQEAIKNAGMAANAAGVSFEEMNAAIQLLDKAGKKGAEGGVALRNVLAIMSREDFMPKRVQEALQQAGVDTKILADHNRSLTERLNALKPILNDSALLSGMFGMENQNAARALIEGTQQIDQWTAAITGTNTAVEQANTIMQSYEEQQARIRAKIDDLKISVFEATSGFSLWVSTISEVMVPLAQLLPLFSSIGSALKWFIGFLPVIATGVKATCSAISTAIGSIPIIGWIAIAISAIAGLIAYFWNTSAEFRAVLKGMWAYAKAVFTGLWDLVKNVFGAIGDLIVAAFSLDTDAMSEAINRLKGGFKDLGAEAGKAYDEAYNAEIAKSKKEEAAKKAKKEGGKGVAKAQTTSGSAASGYGGGIETYGGNYSKSSGTVLSGEGGSGNAKNITTNIGTLVGEINIHTTTLKQSAAEIKAMMTQIMAEAVSEI